MGKLIVIEGTDGSGKQTQTELLYEILKRENKKVKKISFPNYESKSSELVKMYLSGELGKDPDVMNPYAVSSFYAMDRYVSFKQEWEDFYNNDGIIISDRYTISNMIHQGVKIKDEEEKDKFLNWLMDYEWNKIGIPKPDMIVFLDVPIYVTQKLMRDRTNKITGKDKKDIHEVDKNHLEKSYNNAIELSEKYNWIRIPCTLNGEIKSIEEISKDILLNVNKII